MVSYTKLKTRSFINRIVNNPNVSEVKIMNALEECYKNCAFSTFPYIMHNIDSREAIKKYNSGNCVALSIYVKDSKGVIISKGAKIKLNGSNFSRTDFDSTVKVLSQSENHIEVELGSGTFKF